MRGTFDCLKYIETTSKIINQYHLNKTKLKDMYSKEEVVELIKEYGDGIEPYECFLKEKGLIEQFEVGKWYKIDDCIFHCTNIYDKNLYGYGLFNGVWEIREDTNSACCACNDIAAEDRLTLATESEISEALIKEAKKRGFKEGVKITREWSDDCICETSFGNYGYYMVGNSLELEGRKIFNNGKWAEIVEEKPTMCYYRNEHIFEQEEKKEGKICVFRNWYDKKLNYYNEITINGETYIKK